ncbi:MAG: septal ring lytic transglycosylase RlpA family protein [Nitrospiraceae bacterium]
MVISGLRLVIPSLVSLAILSACSLPAPRQTYPPGYPIGYVERGMASWYGPGFHGNPTANGERFDMHQLTAAHRTLPLGSVAEVRSLSNGRHVTVRINDRGPFARGRILDLSMAGARALAMMGSGTDEVELRVIRYQGSRLGTLWVQVGSFSEAANAQALIDRLKAEYPKSRIAMTDLPRGKRYRVQVGEFATETQAEVAATRLRSLLDVDPYVVRDDS